MLARYIALAGKGKSCGISGNDIWAASYKIRGNGKCDDYTPCGSCHVGSGCLILANYSRNSNI